MRRPSGKPRAKNELVVLIAASVMAAILLLGGYLAARRLGKQADAEFGVKELEFPKGAPAPAPPPEPIRIEPPQDPGGPSLQPILTPRRKSR